MNKINAYFFDENKFKKEHFDWDHNYDLSKKSFNPINRSFNWWYCKKQIETSKYRKFDLMEGKFKTSFIEIDNDYLWTGISIYCDKIYKTSGDDGVYYSWKSIKLYEEVYNLYHKADLKILNDFYKIIDRDLKLNEIGI